MSIPIVISLFLTALFGACAIYLSFKEDRIKKELEKEKQFDNRLKFQENIIQAINERISYATDVEKVVDVITGNAKNLFPYSSISSLMIKKDKLIFKTIIEETVDQGFIDHIKINMLSSVKQLHPDPIPSHMEETITGVMLDNKAKLSPSSLIQFPIIVNKTIVCLIAVASIKPNFYSESDVNLLYQITHHASWAISRLAEILQIEKGKLTALIKSLSDGVFMVDLQNDVTLINESAKKILDIKRSKVNIIDILSKLPETDLGQQIDKALSENQSIEIKEIKLGNKTLQVFINPVYLDQNDLSPQTSPVIGASVLLHDITLEKNLSHIKEDFTNMMVHELRAPVTAIKGASELILKNKKLTVDEQEKLLEVAHSQSKKMLGQISLILDAAKVEAGRFSIQKSTEDIKKVINEQIQVFLSQVESKRLNVITDYSENLPLASFDPIRMSQVINNLLSNSIKFTPDGGSIMITATYNPTLMHNYIEITITDTGIGIPKDKQDKLFSKFFQIGDNNSALGSGLGLYITKGIIEAHGGTITLNSEPGHGTTFTFTIPINPADIRTVKKTEHFINDSSISFEIPTPEKKTT